MLKENINKLSEFRGRGIVNGMSLGTLDFGYFLQ